MSSLPPPNNLFQLFTSRLEQLGAPYMVSGSVAAMFYGEPRLTNDVDVIIDLDHRAALQLPTLFSSSEFYCPPAEVITIERMRHSRGHFNIIHIETAFKADVYLSGNDPLHSWALTRAQRVNFGGAVLMFAPIEYVIVRKLEFYREGESEKHLRDIAAMIRVSGDQIDRPKIEEFVEERGLTVEWQKAQTIRR
jgi:hypothetical protein